MPRAAISASNRFTAGVISRAVLLAAAGGKPSDAAAVRGDAAKDCRRRVRL